MASPADMLGGAKVLAHKVDTGLDWHHLLKEGLPSEALDHLVSNVGLLRERKYFVMALGMSPRTRQRKKAGHASRLSPEQSGRAYNLAEVIAKATEIFGSQARAEAWLTTPATALDRHTPIDLMDTVAGQEMVSDLLTRLDYGVYT